MSTTMIMAAVVTAFAVVLIAGAIWTVMNPTRSAKDRLEDLTTVQEPAGAASMATKAANIGPVGRTLARVAAPKEEEEIEGLRRQLIQAGYRAKNNVEAYSAIRFALAVLLPLFSLPITADMATAKAVGIAVVVAAAGYYLPGLLVQNALTKRQETLLRTFPDAMDLMVASVEAGLGIDAAFRRVAEEMSDPAPELALELRLVNQETSAGVARAEALKHLEARTGLEEVAALVNVLVQAERFGTPIARSLRVHSEMVRTKRMQRAEEKAAEISPKLTVAMIIFMLPCLFAILIGPAAIKVIRILLPTLNG